MDKKIILTGLITALSAAGIVYTFNVKDTTPGPTMNDACLAELTPLAKDKTLACEVIPVHFSKWSPANPVDDKVFTPTWICGNQNAPNQECLDKMAGDKRVNGTKLVFVGNECPEGICWKGTLYPVSGDAKVIEKP